ncbi:SMP-30/gluconolactonase/LRE family protein [Crateriforma spongiae]|uniref:SMP-30/gluconolactonase/LRE family protein n=1 Tax=Crateriforma spongiae TaxID=2724528 RepID=UPI0014479F79|nr:SMP-30/gluconolactonase/LRE family protein [Crateriforma spongiae]
MPSTIRLTGILILLPLFPLLSHVQAQETQSDSVVAEGATLKLIGDGYKFTEGPTADDAGNVYFTDQPNDRIVRWDAKTGELSDWLSPCGRSNGLYFVAPQSLIACADENNELWRIDLKTKEHELLVGQFENRRFSGPNDCWVDQDGAIYFTDPLYKRPYWKHSIADDHPRGVYRLSTDGSITQVASDLVQPNGIIGDAEKRHLYVADIGDKKMYRYVINPDGKLTERELFCASGSDGVTLDVDRNLYLTGREGVMVFDKTGKRIDTIAVPKGWTANVTFAGPKFDQLFITAGDSVFTIPMATTGLR